MGQAKKRGTYEERRKLSIKEQNDKEQNIHKSEVKISANHSALELYV